MSSLCRGPIPDSLASLSSLQWLVLSGNQLTGTLPAYLGNMPGLKGAQLQDNLLNGSVPTTTTIPSTGAWCQNNATYTVHNNPSLCGECSHTKLLQCSYQHKECSAA